MRRALLLLAVASLLAGCTFGGSAQESDEGGDYDGGPGIAFVVKNEGEDPIRVELSAIDFRGRTVAEGNATIGPGETLVHKYGLGANGAYTARVFYNWDAQGQAAAGTNEQSFNLGECPELTRIEWRLLQQGDTVASQLVGKRCQAADE